jgi:outer membrane protein OmpA-like peptidoglycan-associated protein
MKRLLALATAALTFGSAQVQAQQPLAFVACPILRDTATVPCWLAEYKGELYSLDESYPPSLGHQALIEGAPTEARRCGGKVLTNLRISIRPDRDPSCDTILPATDVQTADRPQGSPSSNAPATQASVAAPPTPLTARVGTQRFEVLYDFDWQTPGRDVGVIQEAAAYARANPKAEVHVAGFRASVRLADRRVLSEEESIGLRRARELVETLVTLGVDRTTILVVDNAAADLGDHTRRRATIDVVMGGSPDEHSER